MVTASPCIPFSQPVSLSQAPQNHACFVVLFLAIFVSKPLERLTSQSSSRHPESLWETARLEGMARKV